MLREKDLTEKIIGACIEVHRSLGRGLLESTHAVCLCLELRLLNVPIEQQVPLPVIYTGVRLDAGYRLDVAVDRKVVIEIKSVAALDLIHEAQILTYLRLGAYPVGLLVNFNVAKLIDGVCRFAL